MANERAVSESETSGIPQELLQRLHQLPTDLEGRLRCYGQIHELLSNHPTMPAADLFYLYCQSVWMGLIEAWPLASQPSRKQLLNASLRKFIEWTYSGLPLLMIVTADSPAQSRRLLHSLAACRERWSYACMLLETQDQAVVLSQMKAKLDRQAN